jgi:hypothetical protein
VRWKPRSNGSATSSPQLHRRSDARMLNDER